MLRKVAITTVFLAALLGCGRRPSLVSRDAAPPPTPPAVVDADPAPTPPPALDAPAPAADATPAPAGPSKPERDCLPRWRLDPGAELTLHDAAVAGGVTVLLISRGPAFQALLVAPGGEIRAVHLGDLACGLPAAADGSAPVPVGAVASAGNRYLLAWGATTPDTGIVHLRVFTPQGRLTPRRGGTDDPADAAPVLTVPGGFDPQAGVALATFVGDAAVAVRPRDPQALAAALVRLDTAGGAPLQTPGPSAWLQLAPGTEGPIAWLAAPDGAGPPLPFLGPFADRMLVRHPDGTLRVVGPGQDPLGWNPMDGWSPGAGETLRATPDSLVRIAREADGVRLVAYDRVARVAWQVRLPAGAEPVGLGRAARDLVARDPNGTIWYCDSVRPPTAPPVEVRWTTAADNPSTGESTCGG